MMPELKAWIYPPGTHFDLAPPYNLSLFVPAICLVATTLCTALRLFTKLRITRDHGWEDYTCGIAWAGFVAYCAIYFVGVPHGVKPSHQPDAPQYYAERIAKLINVTEILYCPIIFATKLSILLQLLRVFVPNHSSKRYYLILSMIGVNLTELSAAFIVTIFECTPRAKIWDPNLPGQCINVPQLFTANGVICVISDLMILLMPIYWVFQLQMPTKRKFGVAAIFATGIFACISSLLQMVSSIQNGRNSRKTFGPTGSVLWSFGEISAGIVCSTLPIFPRIVRHIREKATKKSTVSLPRNLYTYPAEVAKMRKPLESWQGTYDSHMMTRKYHGLVELDEISRLNTVQSYSEAGLSRAITLEDEISYRESSQAENSQIVVIPK